MSLILNIDGYSGVKQFICVLNTVDNLVKWVGGFFKRKLTVFEEVNNRDRNSNRETPCFPVL